VIHIGPDVESVELNEHRNNDAYPIAMDTNRFVQSNVTSLKNN
jgi:hypothetical protein